MGGMVWEHGMDYREGVYALRLVLNRLRPTEKISDELPEEREATKEGHCTYPLELPGQLDMITVIGPTATESHARDYLARFLVKTNNMCVWGLDVEWKPRFRKGQEANPASLVSLSTPGSDKFVLLWDCLQAAANGLWPPIARCLVEFLSDGAIVKAGMGLLNDVTRLRNEFGDHFTVNGILELADESNCRTFARLRSRGENIQRGDLVGAGGLAGVASVLLGRDVPKDKRVTLSDWNKRPLGAPQLRYAACDAYLSSRVAEILAQEEPIASTWLQCVPARNPDGIGASDTS